MKIILIGNYRPDKQESMKLFSMMLNKAFTNKGIESEIWLPVVFLGSFSKATNSGIGKWLGYFDKWILFPIFLKIRLFKKEYNSSKTRFHICDHSNSPYLAFLPKSKSSITCHDVLAIRGALGFEDAYCKSSKAGIILQKWILKNLVKAEKLVCVSELTFKQLISLTNSHSYKIKNWRVIHNAFNGNFKPLSKQVAIQKINKMGLSEGTPFLLHLGSSLERKNRKLLVEVLVELGDKWNGIVCFAGDIIDSDLEMLIIKSGVQNRVKSIVRPEHEDLLALYSLCAAFIFPSFSEGFGWPVIEAQACGAPVIASNIEPMGEVSGGAALHENPNKAADFARAFLSLQEISLRDELILRGFENCKRFSLDKMLEAYLSLFSSKIN